MSLYDWDDNEFPLAYLITIRTYGTWLHGDYRGSIDRHGRNIYGTPRINPNPKLLKMMQEEMRSPPFILNSEQRLAVHREIEDVCSRRAYYRRALNVRTNHLHAVITAAVKPGRIVNAFKSNATRALREQGLVDPDRRIWSLGKSRRYLWKPHHVDLAIDYSLYQQGDDLIDFDTWLELMGKAFDEE